MATTKKKINLFDSPEGEDIRHALRVMELDSTYRTESSYTANAIIHPDHLMPFIEKHLNYLNQHSDVNPDHYLANLRLSLRIRV